MDPQLAHGTRPRLGVTMLSELYASHSFIHSSGVAVGRWQSFDVPFSLPPALRPRHGPVCNSPLTLGLVLYVYRA